jgi:hypothetical protein
LLPYPEEELEAIKYLLNLYFVLLASLITKLTGRSVQQLCLLHIVVYLAAELISFQEFAATNLTCLAFGIRQQD